MAKDNFFLETGEKFILTDSEEEQGVSVERGAKAIVGLIYLAYEVGRSEAEGDKVQGDWGDFLFDSDIDWTYARAIARGQAEGMDQGMLKELEKQDFADPGDKEMRQGLKLFLKGTHMSPDYYDS
jgi:hypothetical protein|tara:strand:+ start:5140 stop:5514 length:375 start_codon:yes stop_codon:yes gene_type:complete